MPTDLDATDLAATEHSHSRPRRDERPAFRLALGVAGIFVLGMALNWPFAFVAAVFASMFLQAPTPLGVRAGIRLVGASFVMLLFGFGVFSVLLPYRPTFMLAQILLLIWAFSLSVTGKSPLIVIIALMESLMMPFLVHQSMDIALTFAIWLPANMGLALLAAWGAFMLFPAPKRPARLAALEQDQVPAFDPLRRLVRMTLVTVPFVLIFFMLDGGAVLTLLFVAILSYQLASSTAQGPTVAKVMLLANAAGGLVAILAYELVVIDTQFVFMAVITLLLCFILSSWMFSGTPSAALAASALSTALVLFGGAMAPFGDDVDVKMLDRLFQIGAALAWVLVSFVAVDHFLPERVLEPDLPDWKDAKGKVGEGKTGKPHST